MFEQVTTVMRARMAELEAIDARDREDGTPHAERLRQVPPETGRFIALLAASAPPGDWVEVGTSAAYSTIWLALAARARGTSITTYELSEHKLTLARETIARTGIGDVVRLVQGDARDHLATHNSIAFCFLDAEKDVYADCYEIVVPRMPPGGLLVADNAISHAAELGPMIEHALADPRLDSVVVPIGTGDLLCRKR